jgi:hypothetical protein
MFDYAGAIHFHSAYSYDARVHLQEILRSAVKTRLDFAIVTDHFRMDARRDGWEGYQPGPAAAQKVLLIVGEEISPRYNHYLALNLQTPIVRWKTQPDAQPMIDAVSAQGGFGFIAHPDHEGAPLIGTRAFPWIDWKATGFAGLGIWDLIGDWSSALSSHWALLYACLYPGRVLRGPKRQTLARWDALAKQGRCVAIGEIDNHDQRKRFFGFSWRLFPFDFAFRTIRTHVVLPQALSGEAPEDTARLLEALRNGHSYVSLDLWNDPRGFSFEIFDERQGATCGETFRRQGPALLEVKLPAEGRIRLVRDGQTIYEERRRPHLERDLDLPGVYRIEVDQYAAGGWRPWIFSNPIWVE